jgi:predicted dehydrogenase
MKVIVVGMGIPHEPKVELLTYLLKNKKHVMVEKPLWGTVEELRGLQDLAKKSGVTCYTAYNHRFEPHYVNIRKILESGELGKIHSLTLFYGNGTARDVRNSAWRDTGAGVLPDLGSHILDTLNFWLGDSVKERRFEPWSFDKFENRAWDHVIFASRGEPLISCEATLLSWRNTFRLDIVGEKGSAHLDCLCKWGPSTLTVRTRVLPSGRPAERVETLPQGDPTWVAEYAHFKGLCRDGHGNIENDRWILTELQRLAAAGGVEQ